VKKRRTPPPPRGFDVDNNGAFQYPPFWLVYLAAKNRVPKASIKDCGAPDDRMSASCLQGIIPQRLIMRAAAWRHKRPFHNSSFCELATGNSRQRPLCASDRAKVFSAIRIFVRNRKRTSSSVCASLISDRHKCVLTETVGSVGGRTRMARGGKLDRCSVRMRMIDQHIAIRTFGQGHNRRRHLQKRG
jgi:hypothetical protein